MNIKTAYKIPPSLCLKCRGAKLLCGLTFCPIAVGGMIKPKIIGMKGKELSGSSPPSVFVGRYGYPKIQIYPSSPAFKGDTANYENPSAWIDMALEEFLSMRFSLFRGGVRVPVNNASNPDRNLQDIQIMALSSKPIGVEMTFGKILDVNKIVLDDHSPPMGPSAPLTKITIDDAKVDQPVEKVYGDTDLLSGEGMKILYESGIDVYKISHILSIGALGTGKRRRFVPTRWSITATDKNISDNLVSRIKRYPAINEYLAYVRGVPGNLFLAILGPPSWMFEWGEAWFPGSTWNKWGSDAEVEIDHESYWGRKDYPGIGGCYYASKLGVTEKLEKMNRQGSSILWREIYPNFHLPVGVWFVRENIRKMFESEPVKFDSLDGALNYISQFMKVPLKKWVSKSGTVPVLRSGTLDRYL